MSTRTRIAAFTIFVWVLPASAFAQAVVNLVGEGKLMIRHRPESEVALEPTYADAFSASGEDGGYQVRFLRSKAGRVTGFSIYSGRVRHLHFAKQ